MIQVSLSKHCFSAIPQIDALGLIFIQYKIFSNLSSDFLF